MKAAIAIGCVLLAAGSVRGQFVLLQQERSVSAGAELSRTDYPLPGQDLHLQDTPMRAAIGFEPFDETVTANVEVPSAGWVAHGTAWQRSTLSATEIVAAGGPRDVSSCCDFVVNRIAAARSTTRVLFRLDMPTFLQVHAEILDPPNYDLQGELLESGDVSFSLTGPNLAIIQLPNNDTIFENIPAPMPNMIDQVRLVQPGDYSLHVFAQYFGDGAWTDVYYDLRVTATPIPEPDSLAFLLFALVPLWLGRRYVLAHFGK